MRHLIVGTTIAASLSLTPTADARTGAAPLALQPQSRLWVDGTSNVRSWSCAAATLDAAVETTAPGAVDAVMRGTKVVKSATLTVASAKLDCRSGKTNEHMRKALKSEEHRAITFRMVTYDLSPAGDGAQGSATGELTLGGTTKPITVKGLVTQEPGGVLHITGTHALRMTEYGLTPPSLMMGTMKVKDAVRVHFDLLLKG